MDSTVTDSTCRPANATLNKPSCSVLNPPALPCIAILLLVIVFFGLIRYRLRDMPLERDEGEYALSGQLMLQGIPPYRLAYNMKLPGTYAAYAAMMAILGQTPAGIHLGFLLVNAATTLLMYILAGRLFGRLAAVVASASFALLSTNPSILGFQAHATHFILLPAIAAILLLLSALESQRNWMFFASGGLAGLAFLMKQHGFFVPAFCLIYLLVSERRASRSFRDMSRHAAFFALGVILPFGITTLLLYRAGVFSQFWFWTVSYAHEYSKLGLDRGIRIFLFLIYSLYVAASSTVLLWLLAGFGLAALKWTPSSRRHYSFMVALLLLSFLAICPGSQFRPHYFVLLLPSAALLVGVAVALSTELLAASQISPYWIALPTFVFAMCFAGTVFHLRAFYFSLTPEQALRGVYRNESEIFVPALQVGEYVRHHASPSARIAVLGSDPEIYFYSRRLPATGYIYMYGLLQLHSYTDQMRRQMIQEMERNHPEYLVYVDSWGSWGYHDPSEPHVAAVFSWANDFVNKYYEPVGVVKAGEPIRYSGAALPQDFVPGADSKVYAKLYIFKRKS